MNFNIDNLTYGEKFALFYGIMLGDGCLSLVNGRKKFIAITCSLDDDLPFFEKIVSPLLFYFRGKHTNIKFRKDCRAIEFNFVDNKLFDLISSIGFPIGKKGIEISIPKVFYEKNLLNYVVAGFFATDGSLVLTKNPNKFYPRIEANGISEKLISQISNYLNKLGFFGKFYEAKRINDKRNFKVLQKVYRFQFNGKKNLFLFKEKIGFFNPKHHSRFEHFIKYDKDYDEAIRNILPKDLKSIREPINIEFENRMALGRF